MKWMCGYTVVKKEKRIFIAGFSTSFQRVGRVYSSLPVDDDGFFLA